MIGRWHCPEHFLANRVNQMREDLGDWRTSAARRPPEPAPTSIRGSSNVPFKNEKKTSQKSDKGSSVRDIPVLAGESPVLPAELVAEGAGSVW